MIINDVSRINRNLRSELILIVYWLNYVDFIFGKGKGIMKYFIIIILNKWEGNEYCERREKNKFKYVFWR